MAKNHANFSEKKTLALKKPKINEKFGKQLMKKKIKKKEQKKRGL